MATSEPDGQNPGDGDGQSDGSDPFEMLPPAITPEEVRGSLNDLERVRNRLQTDDDFFAALMANQIRSQRIEMAMLNQLDEISDPKEDVIGRFPVEFSHQVPQDTPVTSPNQVVRVPSEEKYSRVKGASLGWPDGADNLVGIKIRTGNGLKLVPRNPQDEFIAYNDFNLPLDLDTTLFPGEELVVETVNLDTDNDHFVNAVVQVEELSDEADEAIRRERGETDGDGGE